MTSSAPRSSARTRSTGSDDGASRITGTFRSHVLPGSPRRRRRQRSSSARSTRSGRVRSASSSASLRRDASEHVEAVVAELAAEVLARLGLRLGDEDGTRHAADASRAVLPRARCPLQRKRDKASSTVDGGRPGNAERRGQSRPWRRTPQMSQSPKTPESTKPTNDEQVQPDDLRALLREHADDRRADEAAEHDRAPPTSRFDAWSMWSSSSSSPGFSNWIWNVPSRMPLEHVAHLVRQLARDRAERERLRPRRCATTRGWKRSARSPRAYGFATSNTLKSG